MEPEGYYPPNVPLELLTARQLSAYLGIPLTERGFPTREEDLQVYKDKFLKKIPPQVALGLGIRLLEEIRNSFQKMLKANGIPEDKSLHEMQPSERQAKAQYIAGQVKKLAQTVTILKKQDQLELLVGQDNDAKQLANDLITRIQKGC